MMSNETTQTFLEVMATFEWPDPISVVYKLYYHDNGTPKCYSMDDLPGKYIAIDAETYALRPWNVLVVDGKLKIIQPAVTVRKLTPSPDQGTCCHPKNICVVVGNDKPNNQWTMKTHEIN